MHQNNPAAPEFVYTGMAGILQLLKQKPVYLPLLPLYFVLHGTMEQEGAVKFPEAALLAAVYLLLVYMLLALAWLLFRDWRKAALAVFCLVCWQLYFGILQDALRSSFQGIVFHRYSFLLPVALVIYLFILYRLRKTAASLYRVTLYLNTLLLVLIAADLVMLTAAREPRHQETGKGLACEDCPTPDIYLIVPDAYSGKKALDSKFAYSNSDFENRLKELGFYIPSSGSSNYKNTPFAMASMLNMEYLAPDMKAGAPGNLGYCYDRIRRSRMLRLLEGKGYEFHNYSIFDFDGQPRIASGHFLPSRTRLITAQTFTSRIWKDIRFNMIKRNFHFRKLENKLLFSHLHNNEKILRLTKAAAATSGGKPRFVYAHLMMPHFPYFFDSTGRKVDADSLLDRTAEDSRYYLDYLGYSNRVLLSLVQYILEHSSRPPVIIMTSDHGYRNYRQQEDEEYCFSNLTAVHLPGEDYSHFYDEITSVNLMSAVLNSLFDAELSYQKDSIVRLW